MKKKNVSFDVEEAKKLFGERAILSMQLQNGIRGGANPTVDSVCTPTPLPIIDDDKCTCPLPSQDSICPKPPV
ncbi:MAG: hypothetical protein PHP52_11050 [Bacteroidales bacterium]|mgnify:CR=1 FL=1|jgi:hypothetical protein|nr:hypothetical protein [Bacteroidales bacterium]MDY0143239.1 hypothetical protein [Bacteroidales bacterium]MDY0144346.1 hypothetical protein [Bacteroidales bacterium]